jgi:hypothetical protein
LGSKYLQEGVVVGMGIGLARIILRNFWHHPLYQRQPPQVVLGGPVPAQCAIPGTVASYSDGRSFNRGLPNTIFDRHAVEEIDYGETVDTVGKR